MGNILLRGYKNENKDDDNIEVLFFVILFIFDEKPLVSFI